MNSLTTIKYLNEVHEARVARETVPSLPVLDEKDAEQLQKALQRVSPKALKVFSQALALADKPPRRRSPRFHRASTKKNSR